MSRPTLDESQIHAAIHDKIASYHGDVVREVQAAISQHPVVVVGMGINVFPKRALATLRGGGVEPFYLEYGSYFSDWHRRLALKMWTGWPTFPMVFVRGSLIGGAAETKALLDSGELKRMLAG